MIPKLSAVSLALGRCIKQNYCFTHLTVYIECLVIVVSLKESHTGVLTRTFETVSPSRALPLLNLLKYTRSVPRGQLSKLNVRETAFCKRIVINIFVVFF